MANSSSRRGRSFRRLHDLRFSAAGFNPGFGNSRLAPLEIRGEKVPTLYAGSSLECAIPESLFHDIDASQPFESVPWSQVDKLLYSLLEPKRDISCAPLFTPDLMKWQIERSQLIDTPKSTYGEPRGWSIAIHAAPTKP